MFSVVSKNFIIFTQVGLLAKSRLQSNALQFQVAVGVAPLQFKKNGAGVAPLQKKGMWG